MVTMIWNGQHLAQPLIYEHLNGFGYFHRLVVRTEFLLADKDYSIRIDDLLVRFVRGEVVGEQAVNTWSVQEEPGKVSIESGWMGTDRVSGRFIEIVAPGPTQEAAMQASFSILGAIASQLGPHVVGDVVFSEHHHASNESISSIITAGVGFNPWNIDNVDVELLNNTLPQLTGSTTLSADMHRAVMLACRWYEKSLRATTYEDILLSCAIGVEAITSVFWSENGPSERFSARRLEFRKWLPTLDNLPKDLRDTITEKMSYPTFADRMERYARLREISDEDLAVAKTMISLRNGIVHPSDRSREVTRKVALDAQILIGRMIRYEMGVRGIPHWEGFPLRFDTLSDGDVITGSFEPFL